MKKLSSRIGALLLSLLNTKFPLETLEKQRKFYFFKTINGIRGECQQKYLILAGFEFKTSNQMYCTFFEGGSSFTYVKQMQLFENDQYLQPHPLDLRVVGCNPFITCGRAGGTRVTPNPWGFLKFPLSLQGSCRQQPIMAQG